VGNFPDFLPENNKTRIITTYGNTSTSTNHRRHGRIRDTMGCCCSRGHANCVEHNHDTNPWSILRSV